MRIGVNTRFLISSKMEGFGWYTHEVCKRLVKNHPEHEFIFFFDRKYDEKFVFGENVQPVVLHPQARHPILFYIWFEWSIKKALKKYNCNVFFSPDGQLSLGSNIPQVAVIHDLNFEHYPEDLPKNQLRYYKKYFPRFAQKAQKIITVSNYSKQDIVERYAVSAEKVRAIWNGASTKFSPISEKQQQKIRDKYTDGEPYFLFVGSLHPRKNVRRLIQAFKQFKQRENNACKLLIVGEEMWKKKAFRAKISKSDKANIRFTGHVDLETLTAITASAIALTYVPYFEGFGIPLVEAMRCGTPIIAGNKTALPEVAGNAAVYCNPFDISDISSKMEELYNNKELLEELSKKGLERAKLFSWDTTAKKVAKILGL